MREELQKLWQLQGLEQRRKAIAQRQEAVSSEELRTLWQELQNQTRQVNEERKRLEAILGLCAEKEQQISMHDTQLKAAEKQLYGGELTHVKEMEQLSAKCQSLKQDISALESELFQVMEECETMTAKIAAKEQKLENGKKAHARKQQEVIMQSRQAKQEIDAIEAQCQALMACIEPSVLAVYQKLRQKIASPVARLDNGVCSGCRMNIPTRQSAAGQAELIYCDNCGRLLLL